MHCLQQRADAKVMYPEHYSDLVGAFRTSFENRISNDLIFICNGRQLVKAHKMVVAGVSEFIKALLVDNPDDVVYISLPEVNSSHLQLLLNYMCIGMTKVTKNELDQIKALRDLLRLTIPIMPQPTPSFVINISSMVPITVHHDEVGDRNPVLNMVGLMQPASLEAVDPLNTPDYYFSQPGPSTIPRVQQYIHATSGGVISNVSPNINYLYGMPTINRPSLGVPQFETGPRNVKQEKSEDDDDDDLIIVENEDDTFEPPVQTPSKKQTSATELNKRPAAFTSELQSPAKKMKSAEVETNVQTNASKKIVSSVKNKQGTAMSSPGASGKNTAPLVKNRPSTTTSPGASGSGLNTKKRAISNSTNKANQLGPSDTSAASASGSNLTAVKRVNRNSETAPVSSSASSCAVKRVNRNSETASVSSSASSSPHNREEVRSSERNKYTEKQLAKLRSVLNRNKNITPELIKKLSIDLKLRESQIKAWFNKQKK